MAAAGGSSVVAVSGVAVVSVGWDDWDVQQVVVEMLSGELRAVKLCHLTSEVPSNVV